MTAEKLLEALGEISPELVLDAKSPDKMLKLENHRPKRRRFSAVLIAAVIILALTATALAGYVAGDWFKGFFRERAEDGLSPAQEQLIDERTVGIGQSSTCNGWTVTVESAICDTNHSFIKVNVEAPEGTVLDAETYFFNDSMARVVPLEPGRLGSAGRSWGLLEDADKTDNKISLMRESSFTPVPGGNISYTDGAERVLCLEDFGVYDENYQRHILAEGRWTFRFFLTESAGDGDNGPSELELIQDGERYESFGGRMMGSEAAIEIYSFQLTSLGAVLRYEMAEGETMEALDFWDIQLVMKDGSTAALNQQSANIDGVNGGKALFQFDAPVVLSEADYILFPGGEQLPVIYP